MLLGQPHYSNTATLDFHEAVTKRFYNPFDAGKARHQFISGLAATRASQLTLSWKKHV